MKYSCLEDRVLVKEIKKTELEVTDGGIIDPNLVKKPVAEGLVISVGEGCYARDTGVFMPTRLAKGDKVLYGSSQGLPITIDNGEGKEEVLIMREGDILIVIE